MDNNRRLNESRFWRFVGPSVRFGRGSPWIGRLSAAHPVASAIGFGLLIALYCLLDGLRVGGAAIVFGVASLAMYGNGRLIQAYLSRGGKLSDGYGEFKPPPYRGPQDEPPSNVHRLE